jgi:site-specific DNA recombinase
MEVLNIRQRNCTAVIVPPNPMRIAAVLQTLAYRQVAKAETVDRRQLKLQREVADSEARLRRLYRSIEDGIVELDDIRRERTATEV